MINEDKDLQLEEIRRDVVGIDTVVPLLDGTERRYVFLDNAASTPTFGRVMKCIEDFMPWYSGVHRGTGLKSLVATEAFDEAHRIIAEFVGADLSSNVVIMLKNTTEAINKLSHRLGLTKDDVVITAIMEHHSDLLPWRMHANVVHIGATHEGALLIDDLRAALKKYAGNVKLVAVTGAANVTGILNPIHDIARWAHEAGARIFVDAAQLVAHRPVDVRPNDDPGHIDFLAFSAHKIYAPFGTGVLMGPRSVFEQGDPDIVGGGVVEFVTLDRVIWNKPPHKDEAGSPNVPGTIGLAKALLILQEIGMDVIAEHERRLLEYGYSKLRKVPRVKLFGPVEDMSKKVGVMPFNVTGMRHQLVAAIFGAEGGIGLRDGCFCAHPYLQHLLACPSGEADRFMEQIMNEDRSQLPGMVRASVGCYNNEEDIDVFIEMLERIVRGEYKGNYVQDIVSGGYMPQGYRFDSAKFFSIRKEGIVEKGEYTAFG